MLQYNRSTQLLFCEGLNARSDWLLQQPDDSPQIGSVVADT